MTKDLLFIIIAMLVAAILGYFIGKSSSSSSSSGSGDNQDQNNRIKDLEAKLRDCENRNSHSAQNISGASSAASSTVASPSSTNQGIAANAPVTNFNSDSASQAMGKKIKPDDLKIVEGIGPKIESILNDNNIKTWKSLADSSAERIREILIDYGGDSYRIHEPTTWPKQARMAFEGKWQELASYQDRLKGGKEV